MTTLPTVIVEVGLTGPDVPTDLFVLGDPVRGLLGTGELGDSTVDVWTDITPWVRSWSITRGATRGDDPTLRYETGTATVELNDGDRRFDPDNLAGPYALAGETLLTPMRRFRIRAVWDGETYPLFAGFTDDWQADYRGNDWTYATVTASDPTATLAGVERTAVAAAGGGEDSGARVDRILDSVSWPEADRVIATGDTTLQATTLADSAFTELLLVQDTEQGELYADAAGRITFRNRKAILTQTRSNTVQVVFGDAGYDTAEVPYSDARPSSLVESLANVVSASVVGGSEQTVTDVDSVAQYRARTHRRLDLIAQTDEAALQWANATLYQYGVPRRRWAVLSFITPPPQHADTHWRAVLAREFGDRIRVIRRPAGGGDPIDRDCFVRGMTHASDGESWTISFVLQSADRYSFFVLGNASLGVLGQNALAY